MHFDFAELDTEPEVVILFKLLSAFGPLLNTLVKHVNDLKAGERLTDLQQAVKENGVNGDFADWTEEEFPKLTGEAKRLILRMTNLDPAQRAIRSEIAMDVH